MSGWLSRVFHQVVARVRLISATEPVRGFGTQRSLHFTRYWSDTAAEVVWLRRCVAFSRRPTQCQMLIELNGNGGFDGCVEASERSLSLTIAGSLKKRRRGH